MNARTQTRGRVAAFLALLRESLTDAERDYTSGSINRALVLLAIPMMLEMSMEAIFALVDIFFVARLGAAAVSVVGITEALLTILYALAIGLSMATTAMVARRIGEKRRRAAAAAAGQSLWIGAALALIIGVGGGFFARDLLALMGAEAAVIDIGGTYTTIMLGGSASIFYIFLLNAVFRGAGDATIAMRSLWLANGINIVLDPCLIFGLGPFPELGVTGAAVATTIGRSTGIAYQVWHLTGSRGRIQLGWRQLRIRVPILLRLLKVSMGGIAQFLIVTSSWVFVMSILTRIGTNAVAGFTIAIRLMEVVFLPAWGLGNAAATLVGQNLGASKPARARRSAWRATWANVGFMSIVCVLFVGLPDMMISAFTDEPGVVSVGVSCLQLIGIGLPVFALGMVLTQAINGSGDTMTPTWLNFISFWLVQIPLAAWLAHGAGLGAAGVAWAVMLSEVLLSVLAVVVFRRGKWMQQVV